MSFHDEMKKELIDVIKKAETIRTIEVNYGSEDYWDKELGCQCQRPSGVVSISVTLTVGR